MKVQTNVRAGRQNRGGGADNPPGSEYVDPVPAPVPPPVSRCVGI
jgi:hypothetical protein